MKYILLLLCFALLGCHADNSSVLLAGSDTGETKQAIIQKVSYDDLATNAGEDTGNEPVDPPKEKEDDAGSSVDRDTSNDRQDAAEDGGTETTEPEITSIFKHEPAIMAHVPEQVLSAAERDFEEWIGRQRDLKLDNSQLGNPYQLVNLSFDALIQEDLKEDILQPLRDWFFPIIVKDKYVSWLRVAYFQDTWKVVGIGGASGAKKVYQLQKNLEPYQTNQQRSIVISRVLHEEYIVFTEHDSPIEEGIHYSIKDGSGAPLEQLMPSMRQKAANLDIPRS